MTKVTVITYPGNQNTNKAIVASKFAKNNEVVVEIQPDFQWGVTNKTPEFLKINPTGKVPVAITPDGPLFESNAIARYVARKADKALLGNNDYEASVIDQWIEFNNNELNPGFFGVLGHIFGYFKQANKEAYDGLLEKANKGLGHLETALGQYKFAVADRITLADIVFAVGLVYFFNNVVGEEDSKKFPKIVKYLEAVLAEPQFVGVVGPLAIKPVSYVFA